jgi:hypothetical protein
MDRALLPPPMAAARRDVLLIFVCVVLCGRTQAGPAPAGPWSLRHVRVELKFVTVLVESLSRVSCDSALACALRGSFPLAAAPAGAAATCARPWQES